MSGTVEIDKFELSMLRIHARSAEERIHQLTEFVRRLAYAPEASLGHAIVTFVTEAQSLICYMEHCDNAPGGDIPDGRRHCGVHAHVMD